MENVVAPFYREVAQGPERVESRWVEARDGTRLRIVVWPEGDNGTILLFPGRTEYAEKYGPTAAEFQARGFATVTVDWRGQGLSDRVLTDRRIGHVARFADYQVDVATMLDTVRGFRLPRSRYLLAHSMGGCIGLRSLQEGLDIRAAVFSAPMWGIAILRPLRPFAWALSWAAHRSRLGHMYAPGTGTRSYVREVPFESNQLTTDPRMYAFMKKQLSAHPVLELGGPSLQWLFEALHECRSLKGMASPEIPSVTFLGSDDHVIDPVRIRHRMASWPNGRLVMMQGARHEPMMETTPHRSRFYTQATEHFEAHS